LKILKKRKKIKKERVEVKKSKKIITEIDMYLLLENIEIHP